MNGKQKRNQRLLMLLLALLALSVAANFLPEHVVSPPPSAPQKVVPIEPETPDVLPSLGRLDIHPAPFSEVHRNIFDFGNEDSAQTQVEQTPDNDAPELSSSSDETLPTGPSLPEIRYIGYYREKSQSNVRLASLSLGGRVYVARVNDVVSGEFKILKVSRDHVIVQDTYDNRIFRLSLGKAAIPVPLAK